MNDDFLKKYRKDPRPEFREALYQRIGKPMNAGRSYFSPRQLALASITMVVLAGLVIALSPAAQAYAASVIRKIGSIVLIDLSGSPEAPLVSPEPTSRPPDGGEARFTERDSEIVRLAGFQPVTPVYLPEGYTAQGPWSIAPLGESFSVYRQYRDEAGKHFLVFNSVLHDENARFEQGYAANEVVTDISLRGQAGVWITGRLFADSPGRLVPTNWLMWAEDGVNYALYSDTLSLEEMLAVVEALK